MALQVEDALSGNVAEFGRLDGVESVFARTKAGETVAAKGVARVTLLTPEPARPLRGESTLLNVGK
jgi:hypothetical protein